MMGALAGAGSPLASNGSVEAPGDASAERLASLRLLLAAIDEAAAELSAAVALVVDEAAPDLAACLGVAWLGPAAEAFRSCVVALQHDLSELVGCWRLADAWLAQARELVAAEIAKDGAEWV